MNELTNERMKNIFGYLQICLQNIALIYVLSEIILNCIDNYFYFMRNINMIQTENKFSIIFITQ